MQKLCVYAAIQRFSVIDDVIRFTGPILQFGGPQQAKPDANNKDELVNYQQISGFIWK